MSATTVAVNSRNEMARGMGTFEPMDEPGIGKEDGQMESAEKVASMLQGETEGEWKTAVAAETKADATIAESKADAVLKDDVVGGSLVQPADSSLPEDVSTGDGFSVKDGAFSVPASGTRGQMARSETFEKPRETEVRGSSMSGIFVIFLIGCAVVGALAMSSAVQQDKGSKDQEMTSMASSVSLGVKPKAAPAALPAGLQEVDVLETFDSLDKKRRGFIDADVLEGLLGPDEASQKAAANVVGNVDRLFYHDFRKLVLQKGPVRDAVLNTASRKHGAPIEFSKA